MLRQLTFTNFKTWKEAALGFGKVTGLFGTNSSGKTSLIQFLLLMKQTKEATDRAISLDFNGSFVSLGAYKDVVHRHDETRRLNWNLVFEGGKDLALVDPTGKRTDSLARGGPIAVRGDIGAKAGRAVAERLEYEIGGVQFRLARKVAGDTAFELTCEGSKFEFKRTPGRPW